MSSVHPSAAVGFDRAAADYERGRPGYPAEAIELVAHELGLGPGSRIVDLAAGTGKLTRALLALGAQLTAVEPVPGMRAQLVAAVPGVTVLDGTAEAIPLPDDSVDAVFVAQAFHWFDTEAAAAEIARVLVPAGALVIIRNAWDESVPWVAELQSLLHRRRRGDPQSGHRDWRERLERTGRFDPLTERVVDHLDHGDREVLHARVNSLSFVALLDAEQRQQVRDDVSALLDRHGLAAGGASLAMPHHTHVVWARAVSS